MIDRRAKKPLRAWILERTDAELTYCGEELAREQKRRRLAVRERRRFQQSSVVVVYNRSGGGQR